jgi:Rod binding domain-containing protein
MLKPVATAPSPQSDLERLRGQKCESAQQEKARLRKATREFEAFFMYELLKTMRKTIPDGSLAGDAPLAGSIGKDTFTGMFDMEIGRRVATGGPGSISDILFRSLEPAIDARYRATENAATGEPIPLKRDNSTPVRRRPTVPIENTDKPVELPDRRHLVPVSRSLRPVSADLISSRFGHLIERAAAEHKLDSALIASVIQVESSGNPNAVSPAGAKGLMQLMDSTAADLGVSDSLDPAENIEGGSRYLAGLLKRFGDLKLALAAYNAGPGAVEKHGGVPPYRETRDYVDKVTRLHEQTRARLRTNRE